MRLRSIISKSISDHWGLSTIHKNPPDKIQSMRTALIYGCGALGKDVCRSFRKKNWRTIGCDITKDVESEHSIVVTKSDLLEQAEEIAAQLNGILKPDQRSGNYLDAIVCVSGGFSMATVDNPQYLAGAASLLSSSVFPSLISTSLSHRYLKTGGLLLLPGALAATTPNPAISCYGATKSYIHYLVRSLGMENSGMTQDSKVVGLAPVILDTPANRAAMPDADFSSWTPLPDVSSKILEWANDPGVLPVSGQIFEIRTAKGITRFNLISP